MTTVSNFPACLEWEDGLLTDGQGNVVMTGGIDYGWMPVLFNVDDEQADMLRRGIEKLPWLMTLLEECSAFFHDATEEQHEEVRLATLCRNTLAYIEDGSKVAK